MNGLGQGWLVARREIRERGRSKGFWAGLVLMMSVVVVSIAAPAVMDTGPVTRDVGLTGTAPPTLAAAIIEQGEAVGMTVDIHRYDSVAGGEEAVRDEDVDVLVVEVQRLVWRDEPDEQLQAVVVGAIQVVAIRQRAVAAGIDPVELLALVAPVPVDNVELGITAGRGPDDVTAAFVMAVLLLATIALYGNLVLTGVVEEKSSRVVEVLLARMPARALLAGKVTGIGLLGFAQFVVTALAALVTTLVVDSVDIPAVSAGVLAWVVVCFALGYTLYAMVYGALGSLASRTEDAQNVAGPVVYVLIVGFWASLIALSGDPDSVWSRLLALFPATAPFAMPGRVALGAARWWEPPLAAVLAVVTIAGLVMFAGRVYRGGILHGGSTLKLRDAWRRAPVGHGHGSTPSDGVVSAVRVRDTTDRLTVGSGMAAVAIGAGVAVVRSDVVIGVAVGAATFVVATRIAKTWAGRPSRSRRRP